jgi:arabinose-5-phosphate isomerase
MKTNDDIPIANANTKLLDALLIMSQKALGMVLITNENTLQGKDLIVFINDWQRV